MNQNTSSSSLTEQTPTKINLDEVCANIKVQTFFSYHFELLEESKRLPDEQEVSKFLILLSEAMSLSPNTENPSEPFRPMIFNHRTNQRSIMHSDFTDNDLLVFDATVKISRNDFIVARLCDILWWRKRNWNASRRAIDSLLNIGEQKLDEANSSWLEGLACIERAGQLWQSTGRDKVIGERIKKIVKTKALLTQHNANDNFMLRVFETLIRFRLWDDPDALVNQLEMAAAANRSSNNYVSAHAYLDHALSVARITRNSTSEKRLRDIRADQRISEITYMKDLGANNTLLSSFYVSAIEACRNAGGRREQIDSLHRDLNEVRESSLSEMGRASFPIPEANKIFMEGRDAIEGIDLPTAFERLADMARPMPKRELEQMAIKAIEANPLHTLMTNYTLDDKGRLVTKTTANEDDPEIRYKSAILAQMIQYERHRQNMIGGLSIEGARTRMLEQFSVEKSTFRDLLQLCPFVDYDRIDSYSSGLLAGITGNWRECAPILTPQIENSVRNIMERSGALVTLMRPDTTQVDYDLNTLLYTEQAKAMFGEDLQFTLQVALVEKSGINLRNLCAHGRIPDEGFQASNVGYTWALVIHLILAYKMAFLQISETQ